MPRAPQIVAALAAAGLAGCHPPAPPAPVAIDPDALLAAAEAGASGGPVTSRFHVAIHSADRDSLAWGGIVVAPPNRFRVDLAGPIGPPLVVLACDGEAVSAWLAATATFYTGPHADPAFRGWMGGVPGAEVVTALLLGRLSPGLGVPTGSGAAGPDGWSWWWTALNGGSLTAIVNPETTRLTSVLSKDGFGATHVSAVYSYADPASPFPTHLALTVPPLDTSLTVDFGPWQVANPVDAIFDLPVPAGATVVPLDGADTRPVGQ